MTQSGSVAPARYLEEGLFQGPQGGSGYHITNYRRTGGDENRPTSYPYGAAQGGSVFGGTGPPTVVLAANGPGVPDDFTEGHLSQSGPAGTPTTTPSTNWHFDGGNGGQPLIGHARPPISGDATTFNPAANRIDPTAPTFEGYPQGGRKTYNASGTYRREFGSWQQNYYDAPHDPRTGGLGSMQVEGRGTGATPQWGRGNQVLRYNAQMGQGVLMEGPYFPYLTSADNISSSSQFQTVLQQGDYFG